MKRMNKSNIKVLYIDINTMNLGTDDYVLLKVCQTLQVRILDAVCLN